MNYSKMTNSQIKAAKRKEFEDKLKVGVKVKLGKEYCKKYGCKEEIITLIECWFEYENGLYCDDRMCPGIHNEANDDDDSIYYLFGNDFENFMDCEVVN